MKSQIIMSGLLALGLSTLSASACKVFVTISCPGVEGRAGANISVCLNNSWEGCQYTDGNGTALFHVPSVGSYKLCINPKSLPDGAKLSGSACQTVDVL